MIKDDAAKKQKRSLVFSENNFFSELNIKFEPFCPEQLSPCNINQKTFQYHNKQDCSYQGEALKVPTAFKGLWGSNNIKKTKSNKKNSKI